MTFGILVSETGYADKALNYFADNLRVDLDNLHRNTDHSIHMAALAGSWLGLIWGFAGLRIINGQLAFAPTLPETCPEYSFTPRWRSCILRVNVNSDSVRYHLRQGQSLQIRHNGQTLTLTSDLLQPLAEGFRPAPEVHWGNAPLAAYVFPLLGLLMTPVYPVINSVVLSALPKSRPAAMTGLIVVFSALGGTTDFLITGQLFAHFDGSRAFYLLLAPMGLLLGSVVWFNHAAQPDGAEDKR